LTARADLTQYSFARVANDLEHIRRTLGYGRLNLSAGSYGTRAAQVYVRAYSQNVRTVLLHSIVPIDIPTPLPMAKTAEAAMESTLKACAVETACNAAFPNIRDELGQIIGWLDSGTVRVALAGGSDAAQLRRGRVAEWFRSQLYRPATAATLTLVDSSGLHGELEPNCRRHSDECTRPRHRAEYRCVLLDHVQRGHCVRARGRRFRPNQGTFLGDYRVRQQQAARKQWLKASIPASYRSPVRSSVPALFVSGDRDGGTPLSMTDHAAKGFLNRQKW
jgi:pimeloyl-ACP methyl ester carboxylesterase